MRKYWIAAGALALAAPAIAQSYPDQGPYPDHGPYPDYRDGSLSSAIPSPREAEAMGHVMGDVAGAILDVDVGPVVDAVDPYARHRGYPNRTLGDLASDGDPYARERMRRSIGAMGGVMGAMAAQAAILAPALERSMADFESRIAFAMRGLPDRDDRHDDYDPYYDD